MVLKPVPVPSFKVPLKVVLVLSVLTLRTELATVELFVMMPLPPLELIEPAVSEKPFMSRVAVDAVNMIALLMALEIPSCKVPPEMVVLPLRTSILERLNTPDPDLVKPPAFITPLTLDVPEVVRVTNASSPAVPPDEEAPPVPVIPPLIVIAVELRVTLPASPPLCVVNPKRLYVLSPPDVLMF